VRMGVGGEGCERAALHVGRGTESWSHLGFVGRYKHQHVLVHIIQRRVQPSLRDNQLPVGKVRHKAGYLDTGSRTSGVVVVGILIVGDKLDIHK
jgi:hypothetical protein